ncbi:MAG TPA: AAA family ATPase [Polyangiaceae bacterium]
MQVFEGDFGGTARFEIVRRLGAGGMGVVYEALDREHGAHVALKTLRSFDAGTILHIKQEFRALEGLQHPNLVQLGDLVEEGGRWFFTMELVRGVDFLSHVRPLGYKSEDEPTATAAAHVRAREPLPALDEGRLRAALAQLARGLSALHSADKVHRDIKPSNILVTPSGRVVLLDFGLVTDAAPRRLTTADALLGTVGYMAPEQARLGRVGAEADWYAVGVLLYFALCGRLPFEGTATEILMRKQREAPPSPAAVSPDVPADLDALCVELLAIAPETRPSADDVLRRLARHGDRARASWAPPSTGRASFVGRRAELALLDAAFAEARAGAMVVLRVLGESGVGKTALVRRFGDEAAAAGALVLSGRCTERELVPYKAVDGVVDALSQHLTGLPPDIAGSLLPDSAVLLPQLFPVLGRLEALADPDPADRGAVEPREARARSFAALRELLGSVARAQPLVVAIDDLQWADADSLTLLGEIVRPPQAPSMLLVCTSRADTGELPFASRDVRLAPLERDDAVELATNLLARAGTPTVKSARSIAEEGGGHPLFIAELARHARRSSGGDVHLDDALWARVSRLDDRARALVELMAVAGAPVTLTIAAQATGETDRSALASRVALLRAESLLRTARGGGSERVEAYHDRVREAVLARLDEKARSAWHEKLATALQAAGDADPAALALHWRGAGAADKAAHFTLLAAHDAAASLAFERAAALARTALELLPRAHPDGFRAHVLAGDALANAGRGPDAAFHYLAAASDARAEEEAVDLRRRAAEQLLRSGHIDEGLDAMDDVLRAVGLRLPRTPRLAMASLLWNKARLVVRGRRFALRSADAIPPLELRRVDACWSVTLGLSLVDIVRAADFQSRTLRLALDAGEPGRLARSLAMASGFATHEGGAAHRRAPELLREAELLAAVHHDPYASAWLPFARATAAFGEGRWRECVARCDEARARFRADCTNVSWELASTQAFALYALGFLGELRELGHRVEAAHRDAIERGDLYAAMNVQTGSSHYVRLAADDDGASRRESSEALRAWSRRGFHQQHLLDLFTQTETDLYVGDMHGAHARVRARWADVEGSQLLLTRMNRAIMFDLAARTELGAARLVQGARRRVLLLSAERSARAIERLGMRWSSAMARLLRAGVSALGSPPEEAAGTYASAARSLDAEGMKLHAAAARMRAGVLDPRRRDDAARARTRFDEEEVRVPERFATMLAP